MEKNELTLLQEQLDILAKRLGYETLKLQNAAKSRHQILGKMSELDLKKDLLLIGKGSNEGG